MGPGTKEEDSFPLDDLGSADRDDPRQEVERLGRSMTLCRCIGARTGLGLRPHTRRKTARRVERVIADNVDGPLDDLLQPRAPVSERLLEVLDHLLYLGDQVTPANCLTRGRYSALSLNIDL
jgi:hypothetical protein